MAETPASQFVRDFMERTKQARLNARLTQKKMGQALGGMAQDTYKNYETKRMLPREYIPTFCLVCGITADWLFDMERGDGEQVARGRRGRPKTRQVSADPTAVLPADG